MLNDEYTLYTEEEEEEEEEEYGTSNPREIIRCK
jgi:hypothetical protein